MMMMTMTMMIYLHTADLSGEGDEHREAERSAELGLEIITE